MTAIPRYRKPPGAPIIAREAVARTDIQRSFPIRVGIAGAAAAEKVEVTYMCWYNNTESEAQTNQALIDKFTYGVDFNRLWWMWPIVTYSNGGGYMSPDGKELWINKPESTEAMQMLADSLKDSLEYGIGVLPKMKKAVTYNIGAPFGIFKSTKHLAEAMEWIKWWADEKNQWSRSASAGSL